MPRKLSDPRLFWRTSPPSRYIQCKLPGGVKESTHTTNERAAVVYVNRREREIADPRLAAAETVTFGVAATALDAELNRRGRSKATLSRRKFKLGHYVRLWGADMPIAAITREKHDEYIDTRLAEGASRLTLRDEMAFLRQLLKLQIVRGKFPRAVEEIIPTPWETGHQPVRRTITISQAWLLIAACARWKSKDRSEWGRSARIAWQIGALGRMSEGVRAERGDMDLDGGTVHVRGSKTDAADDTIPITRIMRPFLEFALAYAPNQKPGPLFDSWTKIDRDLKEACRRIGLPPLSTNDLRRSCATWHVQAGVPNELVAKLLRHTTDKLVQTTYGRTTAVDIGRLIAAEMGVTNEGRTSDGVHGADREARQRPAGLPAHGDRDRRTGGESDERVGEVPGGGPGAGVDVPGDNREGGAVGSSGTAAGPAWSKPYEPGDGGTFGQGFPKAEVTSSTLVGGTASFEEYSDSRSRQERPERLEEAGATLSSGTVARAPSSLGPDLAAARVMHATTIDRCKGAHPPEWDGDRWICARGCGPLSRGDRVSSIGPCRAMGVVVDPASDDGIALGLAALNAACHLEPDMALIEAVLP